MAWYEAKKQEVKHVLLLYSGGLDTSSMILWLQKEYGAEVSTLTINMGQGKDLNFVKEKAEKLGAKTSVILDCKSEFAEDFLKTEIMANGVYMGIYPMATALGRPLIAKKAVEFAEKIGADAIVHGCTGKGNDQVRLEAGILALNPTMKIIAPVREGKLIRADEIKLLEDAGVEVNKSHKIFLNSHL